MHIFFPHAFLLPTQVQQPAASRLPSRIMNEWETAVTQLKINNLPIHVVVAAVSHYSHAEGTGNQFVSNSLPLQTGLPLFFPGNHLNTTKAEDTWASWIQGFHTHVAVARPQPSQTEETMTAGWTLCAESQDHPVCHHPLLKWWLLLLKSIFC